jgi:DNA-binding transcriptional LysR family regulator
MYEYVLENKGLSIERLHLLCEVARAGGIKAAVGDDLTRQSLASRQLKELSEYAGTELCRRIGRTLEMTDAGRTLTDISNDFFQKLESFLRLTRNLPDKFTLGVGDSIFQWQILPKMKTFEQCFPAIQIVSYSYLTNEIIKKVESRTLDAGIVRKTAVRQPDLICESIGEIQYRLFIPPHLTKKPAKQGLIPSIKDIPFCTLTGNGEYAKAMTTFLSAFNGIPSLNCSSMTQVYAAVQSGQYAAVLPANAENGIPQSIAKAYTLPELTPFTRQIALIYKHETSMDATKAKVLDFLRETID